MPIDATTVLMLAVVGLAVIVGLVAWRLRPRRGAPGGRARLHSMERDDSIGYFRDFGRGGPGVREEDRTGRWGAGTDD